MPSLSVLIVEDEPVLRAYFAESVRSHEGLRLVAEAGTLAQGFAALKQHRPQVVLVDLGLPDGDGLKLIRAASAQDPLPDVMVISGSSDEENVLAAVEAGAGGYLLKDGSDTDVAESIVRLVGEAPISPAIAAHLIRRLRPKPEPAQKTEAPEGFSILTDRESQVLQLVAKGLSYRDLPQAGGAVARRSGLRSATDGPARLGVANRRDHSPQRKGRSSSAKAKGSARTTASWVTVPREVKHPPSSRSASSDRAAGLTSHAYALRANAATPLWIDGRGLV
jgi:DNA-binding NarL/FixJ family response regulator